MYCRTRRCIIWNRELRRRGEHVEKGDAHFRWKPTSEGTNAAGPNPGMLRCYTRKDMCACAANATVSLAHRPMWVCPQLTCVPPISIDLDKGCYTAPFNARTLSTCCHLGMRYISARRMAKGSLR